MEARTVRALIPRSLSCLALGAALAVFSSCSPGAGHLPGKELRLGTTPGALPALGQILDPLYDQVAAGELTVELGTPPSLLGALRRRALDMVVLPGPPPRGRLRSSLAGWQSLALVASFFAGPQGMTLADLKLAPRRVICCRDELPLLAELLGCEPDVLARSLTVLDSPGRVRRAVATDPAALGVLSLQAVRAEVRVVPVDGVYPTPQAITAGRYPLARPLFFVATGKTALPDVAGPVPPMATLAAVGDVMLARGVEEAMLAHGWLYPFAETAELLRSADVAFANLECPLATGGRQINVFRADPRAIAGLLYAGIDVVSLANNHVLDYGDEALLETIQVLGSHGVQYAGAGKNLGEARNPVLITAGGIKIAFLAYTEMWFVSSRTGHRWQATPAAPGVAPAIGEHVAEDVAAARRLAELVIVSFHWGREYADTPTDSQRRLARLAIDAGAHLVLGHHPHVLQGIEFYRNGVIAYSLGNFIFDGKTPETKHSAILWATLCSEGVLAVDLVPAFIPDCRPEILEGVNSLAAREKIIALSGALAERPRPPE